MNAGRILYRLAQVYVGVLFVLGVATTGWLLSPRVDASPEVAGLWFAIAGFGLLVIVTILLVHYSR